MVRFFFCWVYNTFNVYRRELAPGTVSLTGDRAQGDDSKHWAYSNDQLMAMFLSSVVLLCKLLMKVIAFYVGFASEMP